MDAELLALLFSPDLNLSPEARAIVAYVASMGEGEIAYARLLRLIQARDEKKLRRAIAEAEDAGWIAVDRQRGKGHHPQFSFTPPKNGTLNETPDPDRVPKNGTLNDGEDFTLPKNGTLKSSEPVYPAEKRNPITDRVPKNGTLNGSNARTRARARPSPPPSTTTPPPIVPPRREDDASMARLRKMLAPHDGVLDELAESTGTTAWAADLWGWYHPPDGAYDGGGTRWSEFQGLETGEAMRALASALDDYVSEGAEYRRTYLRGFVRTAVSELKAGKRPASARASPREKRPPDEQEYIPTNKFTGLKK